MDCNIEFKCESMYEHQCSTCLSVGRKLMRVGHYDKIYQNILSEDNYDSTSLQDALICWECQALLHKATQFAQRAKHAKLFRLGQNFIIGSLSSLTTVILNEKLPHKIYVHNQTYIENEEKPKVEINNEFDEHLSNDCKIEVDIHDSGNIATSYDNYVHTPGNSVIQSNVEVHKVPKTKTRWALKRAMQNKKPKSKILNQSDLDLNDVFHKARVSSDELRALMEKERDGEYYKTGSYRCESCILSFSNLNKFKKHNLLKHNKTEGVYVCDICKTCKTEKHYLSQHISNHYVKFKCKLCDSLCYHRQNRRIHLLGHKQVLACLKCGLKYSCRNDFLKHYRDMHEKFICDYCGVSFKMKYCIRNHIRKQHSPFVCKICDKSFLKYNGLWLHNKVWHDESRKSAYCVECDRRYEDEYRYKWHLANSIKHKPKKRVTVPCPDCEKVFTKNIYMKDHYNLVHLKIYKYRCEECDKNFIRNADLVKHRRRVHEGILPPKNKMCFTCGKGFSSNRILSNHMVTHSGARPHGCPRCAAAFSQRAALQHHVRAVHRD